MARISPEGVIATIAPRTPAGQILSMKRCSSRSTVVSIGLPGVGSSDAAPASSRTRRPRALTSM